MSEKDYDARLTNAAREALDELVSDYRSRVLLRARAHVAQLSGEVREISVRDIIAAAEKSGAADLRRRTSVYSRLAAWYQLLGVLLALSGVAGYLISRVVDQPLSVTELLTFTMVGVGLLLATAGFVFARRQAFLRLDQATEAVRASSAQTEAVGLFLLRWQELELLIRSVVAERAGESAAGQPFAVLLRFSRDIGLVEPLIIEKLRELLELRNRLVHHGVDVDTSTVVRAVEDVETIVRDLQASRHES